MSRGGGVSQRFVAAGRLLGVAVVALAVGGVAAVVLVEGISRQRLGAVLLGLTVLGSEYLAARIAIATAFHPVAVFVRKVSARRALAGELLDTKAALDEACELAGIDRAPTLYVVEARSVNAFVVGRAYERAAGVTTGFTMGLDHDEQRAGFVALLLREDANLADVVSTALGPTVSGIPRHGVRPDFARAHHHYRIGDTKAAKVLADGREALARALVTAYETPGSIPEATAAVAEEFLVWPCGHAVTLEEEALVRARLDALVSA